MAGRKKLMVKDVMTATVECVDPQMVLRSAAQKMKDLDIGCLPVCGNGKLVGMLTDRDIVVRAVSDGMDCSKAMVKDAMTTGVSCCFEHQDLSEAEGIMQKDRVRRLAVLNHDSKLCGIVSLGDVAVRAQDDPETARTLAEVSQDG